MSHGQTTVIMSEQDSGRKEALLNNETEKKTGCNETRCANA